MKRLVILTAAMLLAAIAFVAVSIEMPYQGFEGETFVRLERGSGTASMGRALEQAGVVRHAWEFWLVRALHLFTTLQAGEYRFAGQARVVRVFDRIAHGDIFYIEIAVPEGSNIFDIARLLESAGAMPAEDFLRAASNPAFIRDLDPRAPTLEGYLFPSTYRLSHSTTAEDFCVMMTTQFRRQWKKLAPGTAEAHRAITLASLVEKETGLTEERPLVASVFANRLNLGMKLDCDPTVIYAALLENRYRGAIHRSDLDNRSAYNTYRNAGLPPGPIASPGAQAIAAALAPAETNYLYFVAKPSGGGHQFSSTLADHEKAVRAYRHGSEANQKAKSPRKTA